MILQSLEFDGAYGDRRTEVISGSDKWEWEVLIEIVIKKYKICYLI
jgi:hypothetical protein